MKSDVAVVESFFDAWRDGDLGAVLECLDEDVYFVPSGHEAAPSRGDFSGHEGIRRWWQREAPLDLDPVDIEQLDENHVFAELYAGRSSPLGWTSVRRACVYTIEDEKITAIEDFTDADRAYERARLH